MGWVLGWAVPDTWFAPLARAAFPNAQHVFVVSTPNALTQLEAMGPFAWIVGYSLGSLLLLSEAGRAERLGRVALLAPIFAFPRENNSGGRVALAQIRQLARWLHRAPQAALADFYQRAELDVPLPESPPSATELSELMWGLERLEQDAVQPPLPSGWSAWCGENDPLLDAVRLREIVPEIVSVPGAGHHPAALLRAFAEELLSRTGPLGAARNEWRSSPGRRAQRSRPTFTGVGPTTDMSAPVKTSFDRAAVEYHEHARVQASLGGWLAEWLPTVRAGRALEVGAGPGLFTRKILDWPGGVTATDISPAMCKAGRVAVPHADWRVMAAEKPLAGPWNWILSCGMLQWVLDPAQVFAAWRAQLTPGGRVLAGLFVAESLPELREVSDENGPLVWRTPAEWRASLAQAGLKIRREESARRVFAYRSSREFLRTLHGVGAAPQRRFAAGKMRQILRDYENRFGGPEGVRATWTFYRFEAQR